MSKGVPPTQTQKFTRLSFTGLIYKPFRRKVVQYLYPRLSDSELNSIYLKLYEIHIEECDAVDNGINPTIESPKLFIGTFFDH